MVTFGSIITLYVLKLVFARLIVHLIDIWLGVCLSILALVVYSYTHTDLRAEINRVRVRRPLAGFAELSFTKEHNWDQLAKRKQANTGNKPAIFAESFLLSDSVELLVEYIMRDYVNSWYKRGFKDDFFPQIVDDTIRDTVKKLGDRTKTIELADLAVRKLVPLITEHFTNYVNAVRIVRERSTQRQMVPSKELDIAIAERYGKLHDAVLLTTTGYEITHRRNWLRKKVLLILPFLLNEKDMGSSLVSGLIKDILACSVLTPVLNMLCDPDFINQTITKIAAHTLQDRQKVEKLRAALDAHSTVPRTKAGGRKRAVSGLQRNLKLSPTADQQSYAKFLKDIRNCESLPDARQTRFYISVQIQRAAKKNDNPLYESRLKEAKMILDQRISSLTTGAFSFESRGKELPAYSAEVFEAKDSRHDYTLKDILNDPVCSSFLMEYMDQRRKTVFIQFLLAVNILRDPLDADYDVQLDDNIDPLGGLQVAQNTAKHDDQVGRQDMINIYMQYLSNGNNRLGYSEEDRECIASYVEAGDDATFAQYQVARKALLRTQNRVYQKIEDEYVRKFKESDLFIKYLATVPFAPPAKGLDSSIDRLQMDQIDDDDDSVYAADTELPNMRSPNRSVVDLLEPGKRIASDASDDVPAHSQYSSNQDNVLAVEKALIDIMNMPPPSNAELEKNENNHSDKKEESSIDLPKRSSRLFDDSGDDDSDLSSQDLNTETDLGSSLQVRMAAPGDLSLTEAIKALSTTIEQLYDQQNILDQMISKAELTNNTAELRILYKSRSSLEREVQLKELQKQQYVVQESENSLFGRSDIHIDSYVTSMDMNGPYTLYIIEVRRFDVMGNVTAGWIVGRRYNQFYQLHQLLRRQFPEINKLSFPKKRVVLKFQPKTFVNARRSALEKYLKELLKMPEVCKSKTLRLFLSSETFSLDLMKREGGVQEFDSEDSSSTNNDRPQTNSIPSGSRSTNNKSAGLEVLPFLDPEDSETSRPFVQPLCDLFIQVFGMSTRENWLKGRAVVVIVQQLLGGRIEKKIRDMVRNVTSESKIVTYIDLVRDNIWPNGQKKTVRPPPRTVDEKQSSKRDADLLLHQLFESSGKVVGRSSSRYAAKNLFGLCQNEILNYHLVFSILDVILDELFPELNSPETVR